MKKKQCALILAATMLLAPALAFSQAETEMKDGTSMEKPMTDMESSKTMEKSTDMKSDKTMEKAKPAMKSGKTTKKHKKSAKPKKKTKKMTKKPMGEETK